MICMAPLIRLHLTLATTRPALSGGWPLKVAGSTPQAATARPKRRLPKKVVDQGNLHLRCGEIVVCRHG
jgi:hypothetical protein